MYGVDIGATRLDDLDKRALQYASTLATPRVVDIGCGSGGLLSALAASGASALGVDCVDYSQAVAACSRGMASFVQADARALPETLFEEPAQLIILQRVLHYLRYAEAETLLRTLRSSTGATLFISVTGLQTEIAAHYPASTSPVRTRYAQLDTNGQEKFSIRVPVCLYSRDEFVELLKTTGWLVEEIWTSAFGNHKAVCS